MSGGGPGGTELLNIRHLFGNDAGSGWPKYPDAYPAFDSGLLLRRLASRRTTRHSWCCRGRVNGFPHVDQCYTGIQTRADLGAEGIT